MDEKNNLANNFIIDIDYQVDGNKNVTKLLKYKGKIIFESQSMGNSIMTMNGEWGRIKVNRKYNFSKTEYFNPTEDDRSTGNALFLDNRTAAGTDKTKSYSLLNALMNAAMKDDSKGKAWFVNSKDYPDVDNDLNWPNIHLMLKLVIKI